MFLMSNYYVLEKYDAKFYTNFFNTDLGGPVTSLTGW